MIVTEFRRAARTQRPSVYIAFTMPSYFASLSYFFIFAESLSYVDFVRSKGLTQLCPDSSIRCHAF
jgi:hypothetical protein